MKACEFTIDWLDRRRPQSVFQPGPLEEGPEALIAKKWSWWFGSYCCCYPTETHADGLVTGDVRWESNGLEMPVVGTFSMRVGGGDQPIGNTGIPGVLDRLEALL